MNAHCKGQGRAVHREQHSSYDPCAHGIYSRKGTEDSLLPRLPQEYPNILCSCIETWGANEVSFSSMTTAPQSPMPGVTASRMPTIWLWRAQEALERTWGGGLQ